MRRLNRFLVRGLIATAVLLLGIVAALEIANTGSVNNPDAHAPRTASEQTTASLARSLSASWYDIDRLLVEDLFTTNVGVLAGHLAKEPAPRDPGRLLYRLDVFVRAGQPDLAAATIERLAGLPVFPHDHYLPGLGEFLIEREQWDLARRLFERLPASLSDGNSDPAFAIVRHWPGTGGDKEIDRWLAACAEGNPVAWTSVRLLFRQERGTEMELVEKLVADVKAHPADWARADFYLQVTRPIRNAKADWMAGVCRPKLAYESFDLGSRLAAGAPRAAIVLLERSLATKFTARDRELIENYVRHNWSMAFSSRPSENEFRWWTKEKLRQCYEAIGEMAKAKPVAAELAAVKETGWPLGDGALTSGPMRGQSVRPSSIPDAPTKTDDKDPSDSWLERGNLHAARGEQAQAVEAFEKALDLAPLEPNDRSKRSQVFWRYMDFLERTAGSSQVPALFWKELDRVPLDSSYARRLVSNLLASEHRMRGRVVSDIEFPNRPNQEREKLLNDAAFLKPDNERLWKYLAAREKWEQQAEEPLASVFFERAAESEREAVRVRLEKLTVGGHPSRAATLAGVMLQSGAAARAIPLLKYAVSRYGEGRIADMISLDPRQALLTACLAAGDWKEAEKFWPAARRHFAPRAIPEWQGRIAVAAANAGALEDALRLWHVKVNLDRTDRRHLDELARMGLNEKLRDFYQALGKEGCADSIVQPALQQLR